MEERESDVNAYVEIDAKLAAEESNKGILISMNVQLPDGAIGILSWQEELRDGVTFQDARESAGVHFIAATEGLGTAWSDSVTVSVIDL